MEDPENQHSKAAINETDNHEIVVVFTRNLMRDGGIAESLRDPEAWQNSWARTRDQRDKETNDKE